MSKEKLKVEEVLRTVTAQKDRLEKDVWQAEVQVRHSQERTRATSRTTLWVSPVGPRAFHISCIHRSLLHLVCGSGYLFGADARWRADTWPLCALTAVSAVGRARGRSACLSRRGGPPEGAPIGRQARGRAAVRADVTRARCAARRHALRRPQGSHQACAGRHQGRLHRQDQVRMPT